MKVESKDINLFGIGQTVTIPGIAEFQKTKILRISDCGVTVSSNAHLYTVISGRSPAIPYEADKTVILSPEMQDIKDQLETLEKEIAEMEDPDSELLETCKKLKESIPEEKIEVGRAKRGSFTEKMKHIVLPDGNFTINDLAKLNDIPNNYANTYAKDNLMEVGKAEKKENQKGRAATLYSKRN
jgi:hypothetical protein